MQVKRARWAINPSCEWRLHTKTVVSLRFSPRALVSVRISPNTFVSLLFSPSAFVSLLFSPNLVVWVRLSSRGRHRTRVHTAREVRTV